MKSYPSKAVAGPLEESESVSRSSQSGAFRFHPAVGILAIFALVFLAYNAVLPGAFIMDDMRLVRGDNPLATGQLTPATIWFQTDFPLSNLAFWVEWNLWGNNPLGYHIVNLVLHACGAALLWRLLTRLKVPGAWLAAAIFALHPVCVNSVTRIAEIKNTLSLPFFLLSILFYLRYESAVLYARHWPTPRARHSGMLFYTLSLITFTLALFSKTSTVMLPPVLLACALWQREKITRRDVCHTTPHFALAFAFGLMSIWFQKYQALAMADQTLAPSTFLERFAVAGRVFWFYVGKALLPINLNLIYPQWHVNAHSVTAFVPWFFAAATLAICWRFRGSWGRHVLFGLGCFTITLFPVLGFFDAQFLTRWQVSDHLQYLPLACTTALVAAGCATLLKQKQFFAGAGALVLVLFVLGSQRVRVYASEETLMRDSLAKNPAASEAHNDLGTILARRNQAGEAFAEFRAAVQSDPRNGAAQLNLGQMFAMMGNFKEAESHLTSALQIKPTDATARVQLALLLARQDRPAEARLHFLVALHLKPSAETHLQFAGALYSWGEYRGAVRNLRRAVALQPNYTDALNNLAWLLATCADDHVRNGSEAVRCAEQACQLTQFKQSEFMGTLAAAYAEAGRFQEAITAAEAALEIQTAAGQEQLAAISRQLLTLYRAGKPYHESAGPMRMAQM